MKYSSFITKVLYKSKIIQKFIIYNRPKKNYFDKYITFFVYRKKNAKKK